MSPRKPKYLARHQLTKGIKGLDPMLLELLDSAIDHIGAIIEKTSLVELGGLGLGLYFGSKIGAPTETIALLGLSGLFAAKGLSSDSEAVGIASLSTLAIFGASASGLPELVKKQVIDTRHKIEEAVGLPLTGTIEQKEFLEKTGLGKVVFIP